VGEIEAAIADKVSAAPVALKSLPTLSAGNNHGAGGLAQPLPEPDDR
jgi:hypothetical protein